MREVRISKYNWGRRPARGVQYLLAHFCEKSQKKLVISYGYEVTSLGDVKPDNPFKRGSDPIESILLDLTNELGGYCHTLMKKQ